MTKRKLDLDCEGKPIYHYDDEFSDEPLLEGDYSSKEEIETKVKTKRSRKRIMISRRFSDGTVEIFDQERYDKLRWRDKISICVSMCLTYDQEGYDLGVQDALKQILKFDKIGRDFLKPQLVASLDVIKNIVPNDPRSEDVAEGYYEGYTDALIEAIEFLEKEEELLEEQE